ncbi:MAG: PilZ domain-containing protein, partial [Pseudomonadota bacterium]
YKLGEEVFMLLTLMDSKEKIPVAGHVIWVTPPGAQGSRTSGIGIQFSEKDSGLARNKIEGILVGALNSDRLTHTM